jgi:hypothetical protein
MYGNTFIIEKMGWWVETFKVEAQGIKVPPFATYILFRLLAKVVNIG